MDCSKLKCCSNIQCMYKKKKAAKDISMKHYMKRDGDMYILKLYTDHLKRLSQVKAVVDSSPPTLNIIKDMNKQFIKYDTDRLHEINKENKRIVLNLLRINRVGGFMKSSIQDQSKTIWPVKSNLANVVKIMHIEHENRKLHKQICECRSVYGRKTFLSDWCRYHSKVGKLIRYPYILSKKTTLDEYLKTLPSVTEDLPRAEVRMLSRSSSVFLDFKVKKGEFLGRIVIQLYWTYAPSACENFFRLCTGYQTGMCTLTFKNCPVHRICKNQFIESGDITKGTGRGGTSIFGNYFDQEKHILQHVKTGVVSAVRMKKEMKSNSIFCITLQPMPEWDKKNVVFGKVTFGADVLMKINGYGRFIGKPLREVIISDCGELPQCDCGRRCLGRIQK